MFNLRSVFAFWAFVTLFLGSGERAQAQTAGGITVTIPNTGVIRDHQDYAGKVLVTQINYKDCLNEDFFTFTVNLGMGTDFRNYALEVWAGTSCDQTTARPPSGTATCWRVADSVQPQTIIINNVKVPVRTLLSGRTGGNNTGTDTDTGTSTGGTGGTDASGGGTGITGGTDSSSGGTASGTAGSSSVPAGTPSECTPTSAVLLPQTLSIYFLMLDSNQALGGQAQYKITYKLNAPGPPNAVTAGTGENSAPISWTATTSTDTTIDGYQLYCDPAPGQAGVDESGIEWDPNILPVSCPESSILVEGARPDDKYKCGTANKTSTRATASNLVNMVPYSVAVASTDTYRNVGTVSTPAACAIPQPVTGFFEAYRGAGGEAGGGFCSFSRHGRPVLLVTVLGLGLCLVLRRRRAT